MWQNLIATSCLFALLFVLAGDGAAVLIRSLEPVQGVDAMRRARRSGKAADDKVDKMKEHELCNGPAKFMKVYFTLLFYMSNLRENTIYNYIFMFFFF